MFRFFLVLWTQCWDLEHVYDFPLEKSHLRASRSSLHQRIVLDKEICCFALVPAGCAVATVASGVAAPASMELRGVSDLLCALAVQATKLNNNAMPCYIAF